MPSLHAPQITLLCIWVFSLFVTGFSATINPSKASIQGLWSLVFSIVLYASLLNWGGFWH